MDDESKNKNQSEQDASTVRSMINYYQSLREERVKSIITLQGLLFAALGFSWGKDETLTLIICLAGIGLTIAFLGFMAEAESAIKEIRVWWNNRCTVGKEYDGPPVLDLPADNSRRIYRIFGDALSLIAKLLGLTWGLLTGLAIWNMTH
jgi:hypothetical protein